MYNTLLIAALLLGPRATIIATQEPQPNQASSTAAENSQIWLRLEDAYRESRATGDLIPLKLELQQLFREENELRRRLGLNWIGRHLSDLSRAEQEDLNNLYIELHPEDRTSESLRDANARNRLAAAPRVERAALYWSAVQRGQARIPEGESLDRVSAIRLAAVEGLEEFAPAIQLYASELNARFRHEGFLDSDYMQLLLRFRAGAVDATDALRLHATYLAKLTDQEFYDRMSKEAAFRQANLNVASLACGERQSDAACRELAAIYGRQEAFQKSHPVRTASDAREKAVGESPRRDLPWMGQFKGWIEGMWAKIELEKQELRRKMAP